MRRSWFLPERPDVLGILCRQAAVTCEGMAALVDWANAQGGQDNITVALARL